MLGVHVWGVVASVLGDWCMRWLLSSGVSWCVCVGCFRFWVGVILIESVVEEFGLSAWE